MRQTRDARLPVMDFLLIETMLWGKAQGYRSFNLGMAPLSGMARHRLASRWQRLLDFIARRGRRFYNFEGLRRYKAKFGPYWRPRYLAAPGGSRCREFCSMSRARSAVQCAACYAPRRARREPPGSRVSS